jgi:hypothetical protein
MFAKRPIIANLIFADSRSSRLAGESFDHSSRDRGFTSLKSAPPVGAKKIFLQLT